MSELNIEKNIMQGNLFFSLFVWLLVPLPAWPAKEIEVRQMFFLHCSANMLLCNELHSLLEGLFSRFWINNVLLGVEGEMGGFSQKSSFLGRHLSNNILFTCDFNPITSWSILAQNDNFVTTWTTAIIEYTSAVKTVTNPCILSENGRKLYLMII